MFAASLYMSPLFMLAGALFFFHELTMHVGMPLLRAFTMENVTVKERATVSGMTVSMHWGGLGIGALIGGLLIDTEAWPVLMLALVGMFALAITCSFTFFRHEFSSKLPATVSAGASD